MNRRSGPEAYADVLAEGAVRAWAVVVAHAPPDAYLVGGTALAMRLRHRRSHDLDVFTPTSFDAERLADRLAAAAAERELTFTIDRLEQDGDVLVCDIGDTRVDVVAERCTPLVPPEPLAGFPVAHLEDIAAMKVQAVTRRTALRDRYDLMVLQRETGWTHERLLGLYRQRFGAGRLAEVAARMCAWLPHPGTATDDPQLCNLAGEPVATETADYWMAQHSALAAQLCAYRRRTAPASWPGPRERREGTPRRPPDPKGRETTARTQPEAPNDPPT